MQQQRLKQQQQALMQQSLYHPGLLAPPQIEPILSGNLPPGFDSSMLEISTHKLLNLFFKRFSQVQALEGCKLIRKEKSSYGFVDYFDRRSAALAIVTLNGRHLFGQPIKVNWAYASAQREDTSNHFNIFVGDLSPERCKGHVGSEDWPFKGFGFVSFRSQQDAQSAINDLTGKWLGSRQIRCNWATKGAGNDDQQSSDSKNIVELTNGTSEEGQEKRNEEAPENNPQYTTVYVGNLAPEVTSVDLHRHFHALGVGVIEDVRIQRDKGFGFIRYSTHAEAARAIQMGNARILFGKPVKCSWGNKPTPPGTSSAPLPPPAAAHMPGFTAADLAAYERQLALSKMSAAQALMNPQAQRLGAATQAIYDSGYSGINTTQPPLYYQ
ncbi:Oligouridylate-binding protein 1 [Sesamum angolense]|uniref:Oligouridylate-binding protein 1 n=1 Tax=Sesamum angolense TaxID=2727404 RepID=A0AAE1WPD0_9LAMI|nr:Oligouridylate-binding protein 1 [Sesamum angolense]